MHCVFNQQLINYMMPIERCSDKGRRQSYTFLHQPVIRSDIATTKLRVAFVASAKTTLGTSLNNKLIAGPNLQNELFNIILRFRSYRFVITANITAMFRQILVQEEDRDLQQIFWRPNQIRPVLTYRLNTVTYGTALAPYLAIRCLRQLAAEERDFSEAAAVLRKDFYMDDVLIGANTRNKDSTRAAVSVTSKRTVST